MEILAVIPARGGSKGVPRKNIRLLAGKPLIVHTIEQALSACTVTRTVVSTDDAEIAEVSSAAGAEVVVRPGAIANDTASSESALLHALDTLAAKTYQPDGVAFLQCTSPVRTARDIDDAVHQWRARNADSLVSVTEWHGLNWVRRNGVPRSANFNYHSRPRRQDMSQQFRENGSIFIFRPEILRQTGNRLGGRIELFPMSPLTSVETDTEEGFLLSECLLPIYRALRA
jgi:N-acylneuraminate cytidylyltransferase